MDKTILKVFAFLMTFNLACSETLEEITYKAFSKSSDMKIYKKISENFVSYIFTYPGFKSENCKVKCINLLTNKTFWIYEYFCNDIKIIKDFSGDNINPQIFEKKFNESESFFNGLPELAKSDNNI